MTQSYSLSISKGDGNIGHNSSVKRREKLENVDSSKIKDNVSVVHTEIKAAYHEVFDEAVKEYNLTQKRSDRRITDYYQKISKSKKEKTFYEFVVQVGNMDLHPDQETTNQIYTEFVLRVQEKYPQIHVFGAYIHNDEATPHLHLDFIPFAYYDKGQRKRVSLSRAMTQMGYSFNGKDERDKGLYKAWRNDLMNDLEEICIEHNLKRENMHNTEKHDPNVKHFKEKKELEKEIEKLIHIKEELIVAPTEIVLRDPAVSDFIKDVNQNLSKARIYDDPQPSWIEDHVETYDQRVSIMKTEPYVKMPLSEWNKKKEKIAEKTSSLNEFKQYFKQQLQPFLESWNKVAKGPRTLKLSEYEQIKKDKDSLIEENKDLRQQNYNLLQENNDLKWYKSVYKRIIKTISKLTIQGSNLLDHVCKAAGFDYDTTRLVKTDSIEIKKSINKSKGISR